MSIKIVPTGDHVVLQIVEQSRTAGGLYIPEKAKHNRDAIICKVIAVGPGRDTEYGAHVGVDVAIGDLVLITRVAGVAVELEYEQGHLRILRSQEILGKVEESRLVAL